MQRWYEECFGSMDAWSVTCFIVCLLQCVDVARSLTSVKMAGPIDCNRIGYLAFPCADTYGCVFLRYRCDKEPNCFDGSDEIKEGEARCCLNDKYRCNGYFDCIGAGADELECCGHHNAKRNGIVDCIDGSDEITSCSG